MNIAEILAARAADHPDAPAIIEGRGRRVRRTTFAELDRAAAKAAGLLQRTGLRRGDSVLVLQPMSTELYVALSAIFRLGLIAMFLDPSSGREHVERCCRLQPPRALIASTKAHLLRLHSSALRGVELKFAIGPPVPGAIRWSKAVLAAAPCEAIVPLSPESPALLTFTSGNTGEPKAALRTHGFLLSQHRVLAESLRLTAGDTDLTTLPIVLLANLASGVTSVIPDVDLRRPGHIDPAPVVEQIRVHKPASAAGSPALFARLAQYCSQRNLMLPSFKKLFLGGAPVFPRLMEQLQATAPNAEVTAVYGSTEAEPVALVAWSQVGVEDHRLMSSGRGLLAGRPVAAIRLAILPDRWGQSIGPFTSEAFDAERLPTSEAGEIVVSGEHVLKSYLHGHDEQAVKFEVEQCVWHRTGDAGYLDERGRLWLLGRCSARINDARGTLYPLVAEAAAMADPRVGRAALAAHAGRRILAIEPSDPRATLPRDFLNGQLNWAHIDDVRICRKLPVDSRHNAKIDYLALTRQLERWR